MYKRDASFLQLILKDRDLLRDDYLGKLTLVIRDCLNTPGIWY